MEKEPSQQKLQKKAFKMTFKKEKEEEEKKSVHNQHCSNLHTFRSIFMTSDLLSMPM